MRQIGHVLATITGSNVQTKTPIVPRVRARQASGRTLPANLPGRTSPCPNIITRLDSVSNAIFDSFAGRIFPGRVANCFHSLHEYRPPSSRWKPIDTGALSLSLSLSLIAARSLPTFFEGRVCPRFIHPGTAMFGQPFAQSLPNSLNR